MTNSTQNVASVFDINLRKRILALVSVAVFATAFLTSAPAQTLQVLHNFTWGVDGRGPLTGVVLDRAGNLYGVAQQGEDNFPGVVFKMTRRGSSWTFTPIHTFVVSEGISPQGVTIGPDGNLYGVASGGGANCGFPGCGTVFKLTPPARFCASLDCSWPLTVLYNFQGGSDGYDPVGGVIFDQAGNLYGTTFSGGLGGYCCGVAFEMSPAHGSWTYNVIHTFGHANDGDHPQGPLALDSAANLYGTTIQGGTANQGAAFQMTPSASGWNESVLWSFLSPPDGNTPNGGVFVDPAGNVYGTAYHGGTSNHCGGPYCGAVFEVSPANGGWTESLPHSFDLSNGDALPLSGLSMDAAGNFYGTTHGYNTDGNVFKLTYANGAWTYTSLHRFGFTEGAVPSGIIAIDADGNLYGTTSGGGTYGYGVVWEITP